MVCDNSKQLTDKAGRCLTGAGGQWVICGDLEVAGGCSGIISLLLKLPHSQVLGLGLQCLPQAC